MGASWRVASRTRSSSCHRLFFWLCALVRAAEDVRSTSRLHVAQSVACSTFMKRAKSAGHADSSAAKDFLLATAKPILEWWSGRRISEVNKTNCRTYVKWRTSQFRSDTQISKKSPVRVSDQTARHDLKTLRSCSTGTRGEHDPQMILPRSRCLRRRRLGRTTGSRVGSRAPHPTCEEAQAVPAHCSRDPDRCVLWNAPRRDPRAAQLLLGGFDLESGTIHRAGALERSPTSASHRLAFLPGSFPLCGAIISRA
jgi:hypothetical protein